MSDKHDIYEPSEEEKAYLRARYIEEESQNRLTRALFLQVFSTKEGQQVLKAIREGICSVNSSCFNENPVAMARRAGRQEVAFDIEEVLSVARQEAEEDAEGNV